GINEGADDLAPAHEQAERNSDTRTDEIPDDDPAQAGRDVLHQLTVADEFDRAVERRARRRKKRWLADPPGQYRPDNERADQRGAKGDIVRHRVIIPSPSLARGLDADLGHFRHGICLMALVTSSSIAAFTSRRRRSISSFSSRGRGRSIFTNDLMV